ncbi:MAG: B12-binding domain-containing radical SAM protein [Candidatus Omnitrophica bacterium]|nr:B12-binding domain-containing radical SAM protein [Candidatus Omnitrophota bacterium]MBU1628175.1 B12-binding domain-containing radical SAM protein [bacterium]
MKVLLINAVNVEEEIETRYSPLGLAYLSSYLKKHLPGTIVKIVSAEISNELDNFKPDIVGIGAVSQNFGIATKYAKEAKNKGYFVVLGGIHISTLPESLPEYVDVGVIGEGEQTFLEILRRYPQTDFESIKGVVFWKDGNTLTTTSPRELIEDLDSIPFPDRDILGVGKHAYIMTSRGCPFKCRFCSSARFWGRARFASAEYVANEISLLVQEMGVKRITIYDDLFTAKKSRLRRLVELLEERQIISRVKFSCSSRANITDEETICLLKRMGVVSIGFGFESGNERMLQFLKGESIHLSDSIRAACLAKKHGLFVNGSFVIGSPDETKKEILDTYNFMKKLPLDSIDVYVITPFPGTYFWEVASRKQLVSHDMNWDKLNINFAKIEKDAIILSDNLSYDEIRNLYRRFRRFALLKIIMRSWRHPFVADIPMMLVKRIMRRLCLTFKIKSK